jgi:predicted ArsR family transcriptional regulator
MKPAPVSQRILDALQLQPMTVEQLATCLSLYRGTVRKWVLDMRHERSVRAIHAQPSRNGRPWVVYSINPFRQPQRGNA